MKSIYDAAMWLTVGCEGTVERMALAYIITMTFYIVIGGIVAVYISTQDGKFNVIEAVKDVVTRIKNGTLFDI